MNKTRGEHLSVVLYVQHMYITYFGNFFFLFLFFPRGSEVLKLLVRKEKPLVINLSFFSLVFGGGDQYLDICNLTDTANYFFFFGM